MKKDEEEIVYLCFLHHMKFETLEEKSLHCEMCPSVIIAIKHSEMKFFNNMICEHPTMHLR